MLAAIVDPATGEEETVLLFMRRRRTSPHCCSTLLVRSKWRGVGKEGKGGVGRPGRYPCHGPTAPCVVAWRGGCQTLAMGPLIGVEYYRVKDIAWNVSYLSCNYPIRRGTS